MTGTDPKISTPAARDRSGPVPTGPWIIRDHGGNYWGPFFSGAAAIAWAKNKWPDIPEWEEGIEGDCWAIEHLWTPD